MRLHDLFPRPSTDDVHSGDEHPKQGEGFGPRDRGSDPPSAFLEREARSSSSKDSLEAAVVARSHTFHHRATPRGVVCDPRWAHHY